MTAKEKLREQVETLTEGEARRLLEMVEREQERAAIGEAIAEGYRRTPQSSDEDAWATANAREAIREEKW